MHHNKRSVDHVKAREYFVALSGVRQQILRRSRISQLDTTTCLYQQKSLII